MPTGVFELNPGRARLDAVNLCFTEWVLFERPLRQGRTPLQLLWIMPPTGWIPHGSAVEAGRADADFFSRFAILSKDGESGMARLRNV